MSLKKKLLKSLYVHVPFCRKKCPYCDFYSVEDFSFVSEYEKALLSEFSLRNPEFTQFPTVYFGGGTPSTLKPNLFYSILSRIGQFSEVTVELNPEDVNLCYLRNLKELGVNRISLGVQSFSDNILKKLGRRQKSIDNLRALEIVFKVFSNVSIDIIYGAPKQTILELEKDLSIALSFPIKHISLYALTVYEETPFYKFMKEGKLKLPEEEKLSNMYYFIEEFLTSQGFKHYEISNFALLGFESKHNLNYWYLENYLGIGVSAGSYVNRKYWKNTSNLKNYIKATLYRKELPEKEETIYSEKEEKELKLIMGLRLIEGVNLERIQLLDSFKKAIEKSNKIRILIEEEFLIFKEPILKLGKKGLFTSNAVISEVTSEIF
ncbi:oxygen-independent coproporphyrinogen III oxidase [Desulfurobacterium thermolithotrophum DSM 11699]|uniref:Heme chaperone HemW n=1 Tax=Desulfurobacterium thermolithotrophum (strain DSM 11699 / BSA) TaxID=868864 RepID=F0S1L6_DESTD|nr:radical SAM family heme chaperone HemW [Desulfurobacterium thermolithotrophum]ADY74019.1 oxygen-independent coproporphyrinogen III oxidase [Desulfurobacterium thermolithotrophum DSM 11699]